MTAAAILLGAAGAQCAVAILVLRHAPRHLTFDNSSLVSTTKWPAFATEWRSALPGHVWRAFEQSYRGSPEVFRGTRVLAKGPGFDIDGLFVTSSNREDRAHDRSFATAACGWPFRSLRTTVMSVSDVTPPRRPWIPVALGFAANTALYAAPLFLAWLGIAWLRRRRWGPSACRGCGYDLSGLTAGVCPECGKERAA